MQPTQRAVRKMVVLLVLFTLVFFVPSKAIAQVRDFEPGRGEVVGNPNNPQDGVATLKGFEAIFSNFVTISLELAGIVIFVMFLIGGFKYLTAGGDQKAVEAAKGTLTHAIAGLIVLILAFIILLIVKQVTGVDVTTFTIYKP